MPALKQVNNTILLLKSGQFSMKNSKSGIKVIDSLVVPCGSNSLLPARQSAKEIGVQKLTCTGL